MKVVAVFLLVCVAFAAADPEPKPEPNPAHWAKDGQYRIEADELQIEPVKVEYDIDEPAAPAPVLYRPIYYQSHPKLALAYRNEPVLLKGYKPFTYSYKQIHYL